MNFYENWWEEKRSAYLYGVMSRYEKSLLRKKLFSDLKTAAEKQAALWENKMQASQVSVPEKFKPDFRSRLVSCLVRLLGTENIRFILSAMKIRGMSIFIKTHHEHKHTSLNASSNLRAAVFGINDGLISNISLILGVAAAKANLHFIILAGVSGLLAGACSMGAGEYISVRSQREVFEHQIEIEKKELEEYPEEEKQELSLIYQARGLAPQDADKLANLLIDNPNTGLDTLAREELGLNPDDLVSPIGAMMFSFFSFALGAFLPLSPFLFVNHTHVLWISVGITGVTLFIIGALLSLFNNRNPIILGLRMLLVGVISGGITYLIGKLLGIAIL